MAFVSIKNTAEKIVGMETKPVFYGKAEIPAPVGVAVMPEIISLSEAGHEIPIAWKAVPECTGAKVEAASLTLAAALVQRPVNATVSQEGHSRILKFGAPVTVTKLVFTNLKMPLEDGTGNSITLRQTSDLPPDRRLVVSAADAAGNFYPMAAAPASPQREMLPPPVGTASFASSTLSFTGIKTEKVRLSLVSGEFPEDYVPKAFEVASITAFADFGPTDCRVVDGAGKELWSFPGELSTAIAPAEIDLKIPLETALNSAISKKEAPNVSFLVKGGQDGKAKLWKGAFRGRLVRSVKGVTTVELDGESKPLPCFSSLPEEVPTQVVGDLAVRYKGIRLCTGLNDYLPTGAVSGTIVETGDVVRPLASAQLAGLPVARIGLIGRAPEKSELAIRLVRLVNGIPAETLGAETVIAVDPSPFFSLSWCDPKRVDIGEAAVGLAVRAVSGRFFWAKGNENYLVKIAVYDKSPAQQPVTIKGETLVQAGSEEISLPGHSFPAAPFSKTSPVLDSLLFLTVDFSDLELGYAR